MLAHPARPPWNLQAGLWQPTGPTICGQRATSGSEDTTCKSGDCNVLHNTQFTCKRLFIPPDSARAGVFLFSLSSTSCKTQRLYFQDFSNFRSHDGAHNFSRALPTCNGRMVDLHGIICSPLCGGRERPARDAFDGCVDDQVLLHCEASE